MLNEQPGKGEEMVGVVRWYSAKGFGFIDALPYIDGASALYFHLDNVKGREILKSGDRVIFETIPAPKGPKCINVVKVTTTKDSQPCLLKAV